MSCVDRADISIDSPGLPLVVEGRFTDEPGHDTVTLTWAYPVDGKFHPRQGLNGAEIYVRDSHGVVDTLVNVTVDPNGNPVAEGYYVSHTFSPVWSEPYQLMIKLRNGVTIESTPQEMYASGSIDSVYVEFVRRETSAGNREDGFNVFIDATLSPSTQYNVQWKFENVSHVFTTCCQCWVYQWNEAPVLSSPDFTGQRHLRRVFMYYYPLNGSTFYDRCRIEITQMELSPEVFTFYHGLRNQLINASSLFQPPFFELNGNIKTINHDFPVVGIFSVTSVVRRQKYVDRQDIPYSYQPSLPLVACTALGKKSLTNPPADWN